MKNISKFLIIAFKVPNSYNETFFEEIFFNDSPTSDSCGVRFIQSDYKYKDAVIFFPKYSEAKDSFIKYNKTIHNNFCLDLILADIDTIKFLTFKRKTLCFNINLSKIDSEQLDAIFLQYGPIKYINYDKEKHQGSVTFGSTEDAIKAKFGLNESLIDEDFISVCFNNTPNFSFFLDQCQSGTNLKRGNDSSFFVFYIPGNVDEEFIEQLFEDYNLIKIEFGKKFNYDNELKKYALLTFDSKENRDRAYADLNFTKLDTIPIRFVLADDETRRIISTNEGKVRINNLERSIEVSQLHEAFENFGPLVESEIPLDNGVSRGYGWVQYRNPSDAKQAINDLVDAKLNGITIEVIPMDEISPNDPQKEFLYIKRKKKISLLKPKNELLSQKFFNYDFSLFDNNNNNNNECFTFFVNENPIICSKLVASFLSPKIANNIQNDKLLNHFNIKFVSLYNNYSSFYEIVQFLVSLLDNVPSKPKLGDLIYKMVKQIISSTIENNIEGRLKIIVDDCSEYLLEKKETTNDDFILNFIALIEVFTQFGNESINNLAFLLLLNKIKESKGIKNDLILLIKLVIKRMMNDTNDLKEEIDYLSLHFIEIDPYILNQIDLKVIENAIVKRKNDCQDSLLYKILRLDKSHKQHLICFVDFQLVSNKAMKLFLSSIDFSFISEHILETISIRLSLPIADIYEIEDDEQDRESRFFSIFFREAIQNSVLSKQFINDKNFIIFVNDRKIEINRNVAVLISPLILKNIQTDITCNSFYLNFDQVEFFNEFSKSLAYFLPQQLICHYDKQTIERKIIELLIEMFNEIEEKGIDHFMTLINTLHSSEKNILSYTGWITLFIYLGNIEIAEYLVNSLVESDTKKITSTDDLFERLHHKEVLSYNSLLEIMISNERNYIANNFALFFSKIESFDNIDENIWKVISIRLSIDVEED